jgi:hypothetical protein
MYGSRSKNISCTTIFPENLAVYEIMWETIIKPAGHKQQYNAEHALSMLNKEGYRHTLRILILVAIHGNSG